MPFSKRRVAVPNKLRRPCALECTPSYLLLPCLHPHIDSVTESPAKADG